MKSKPTKEPHKLGANKNDPAVKTVKHDANFKQSSDIREDRGIRQAKNAIPSRGKQGK